MNKEQLLKAAKIDDDELYFILSLYSYEELKTIAEMLELLPDKN